MQHKQNFTLLALNSEHFTVSHQDIFLRYIHSSRQRRGNLDYFSADFAVIHEKEKGKLVALFTPLQLNVFFITVYPAYWRFF